MGVYRQRPLLTALVAIFLITTFTYYTGYSIQPADTLEPIERPKVPVTTSDLAVTLHQVHKDPPTIQVIVENKHPHSFITILLWDSPLDFLALPLGLFEVKPEGSDKILPMNKTEIKRRYPPKWEVLLEMHPGDRRAQDVVLDPPLFPLEELRERGKTATIQMKGRWKAVWEGTVDDVTEESLRSIEVNRGGMMGRFETDELEIDLWETETREPVEGESQEEPPQEGPPPPKGPPPAGPPPEEDPLEGELPPDDERPEEERPVEERPPEDQDEDREDREDIGKVHKGLKPDEKERDDKKDKNDGKDEKNDSKETSKEDAKDNAKDDAKDDREPKKGDGDRDSKTDDDTDAGKEPAEDEEDSKKDDGKKSDKDDEKPKKDSKKGDKGKDDKKDSKDDKSKDKGDGKDDVEEDVEADLKKPPPPDPGRDDDHPGKDLHDDESRKDDERKRVVQ